MASILLIDDDDIQRLVAQHALQSAGHTVQQAVDGEEGLRLIRSLRPDLVVCDVMMPRMNGYQVVSAVRKDPAISATPVILLTAMSERSQVRLGMTSGADDYLPKPYRPQELLDAVEAVLDRRSAQHEALLQSLHNDFVAALEHQKQALASKYEQQLMRELNSRWEQDSQGEPQQAFAGATLLLADLFGALHAGPQPAGAELVARAFQAARDTLYLFGAEQVLPYGEEVLAVFAADERETTAAAPARCARAAFALQNAAAAALQGGNGRVGLTVALHRGDLSLIKLKDVLHGDGGCAPLPGPALQFVSQLQAAARGKGWPVAASAQVLSGIPADLAVPGAATLVEGVPVAELRKIDADA